MFYGMDVYKNFLTSGFSVITLGIAMYVTARVAGEYLEILECIKYSLTLAYKTLSYERIGSIGMFKDTDYGHNEASVRQLFG
jgi:hypothetical protein